MNDQNIPNLKGYWTYYVLRRDQVHNGFEGSGNAYNRLDDRFFCYAQAIEQLEAYENGMQHHQEYEIVTQLPEGCLIT